MFKVGLTGGIGCGKTTVANIFAELTVPVIDADQIARQLVQPGEPALAAIIGHFGDSLLAGGQLDRARLRARIFADERQRVWLENLLHPLIYADMQRRVDALPDAYAVLAIPLLLETGRRDFVDRLLVVDCEPEVQQRRVMARDGVDAAAFRGILAAQASRSSRLAAADDVLENNGDLGVLRDRVRMLHERYLRLAAPGAGA